MIDLKRTHSDKTLSRATATGTVVAQEGLIVCAVLEAGEEKAKIVAAPASTDKVLGFTKTGDSQPARTSKVDKVLVPATGVLTAQLSEANIVVTAVRAVITSTAGALTVITTGTPASGEVLVATTGLLTFHADQASKEIEVTYLFDLTVMQSKQRYGERHVNNRDLHATFANIEVGVGYSELYTDAFDGASDWTSTAAIKLGANGILTKSGSGPTLNLVVVHVPSAELPFLGVRGTF